MNSATKISTVLIVTLSLLCCVEGLFCNVCDHAQNSKCLRGQDRCFASTGYSCSSVSFYQGSKHLFSEQSCVKNCKEKLQKRKGKLIITMCCDKNLCNTF